MKPILYSYNETAFTTRGIGALSDCVSCIVTEELNGGYTLELKYPKNGVHQESLLVRNIIVCSPNRYKDREAFRIYKVDRRLKDYITVYANQLSYDLSGYAIRPVAISDLAQTIYYFDQEASPFNITTNKTSSTPFHSMHELASIRSWFGGKEGSLIDVYGGEWEYDFFNCNLATSRGSDTGLRISYGVNLADYIRQNEDNMYSHVMAYYCTRDELGNYYEVHSNEIATGATDIHRVLILNVTSEFQTAPTSAQLTTYATDYVTAHSSELVGDSVTITVTPEILNTQEISLGDTVHVIYNDEMVTTRVIKTVWDAVADKYTSVVLGTKKANIAQTIKSLQTNITPTEVVVDNALNSASTHPVQNKVIKTALDGKVDKVTGKGLSTNDYTTAEKNKLASLPSGDSSTTFTATLGSVSASQTVFKRGDWAMVKIVLGNGTAFSTASGVNTIGTVPSGYRPKYAATIPISARNMGGWASATYYHVTLQVDTNGDVLIIGKTADVRACQYLNGTIVYPVA